MLKEAGWVVKEVKGEKIKGLPTDEGSGEKGDEMWGEDGGRR